MRETGGGYKGSKNYQCAVGKKKKKELGSANRPEEMIPRDSLGWSRHLTTEDEHYREIPSHRTDITVTV